MMQDSDLIQNEIKDNMSERSLSKEEDTTKRDTFSGFQKPEKDPKNDKFEARAVVGEKVERNESRVCQIPNAWCLLDPHRRFTRISMGVSELDIDVDMNDIKKDRQYLSFVNSKQKGVKCKKDLSRAEIYYTITSRKLSVMKLKTGVQWGLGCMCVNTENMNRLLHDCMMKKEIEGVTRKMSFDLCAIVMRIGACLAQYSLCGFVREDDLTGGFYGNVFSAGTHVEPQYAEGGVFIPPLTSITGSYMTSTLVRLCWGCGTSVSVCNMRVQGDRNVPILDVHRDQDTAPVLYSLLHAIIEMYSDCGRGTEAILALSVGVHSIMSVRSHSQEGGLFRDALRGINYAPPYGAFIPMVSNAGSCGLPNLRLGSEGWSNYGTQIDSFALATAALVCVSDPGVQVNDQMVPTFMNANSRHKIDSEDWKVDIYKQQFSNLLRVSKHFCHIYIQNLGRLTGTECVATMDRCVDVLYHGFERAKFDIRHLSLAVLAPWYWIEPTSLFSTYDWAESIGTKCGWGIMCSHTPEVVPCLDGAHLVEESAGISRYVMPCGPMRKHSFIQHIFRSRDDGLVFMRASYLGKDGVTMRGQVRSDESVEHGALEFEGDLLKAELAYPVESNYTVRVDKLLWGHRDCNLIAPAESLFIQQWYLDVRSVGYHKLTGKTYTVLSGAYDDLEFGVTMWADKPRYVDEHVTLGKVCAQVERLNADAAALKIARLSYEHQIVSSTENDLIDMRYSLGARKESHEKRCLARITMQTHSEIGRGLPSRPPVLLSDLRAQTPLNLPNPQMLRSLPSRQSGSKQGMDINDRG